MNFKKRNSFGYKPLRNPPIIEALFEMRWKIWGEGESPMKPMDKKFKFFPARFYEKMKKLFPYVEVLPHTNIPDQMDIYLPRYRFREKLGSYPLIQIGPGILTVNVDKNFTQGLFFNTCIDALNGFFEVLPDIELAEIILHYIDGFDFDYEKKNAFNFLDEKLCTHFAFNQSLFESTNIKPLPSKFHLEVNYHVEEPKGDFRCQFRSGIQKQSNEKIILMDGFLKQMIKDSHSINSFSYYI